MFDDHLFSSASSVDVKVYISYVMGGGAHGYGAAFDGVHWNGTSRHGSHEPGRWCKKMALEDRVIP